ncbi:MAG: methyltransferase domain-containing protein [Phycisphaera sp.]|nr:methyltransferase domain-containing protein [Phycisphaera sp.]
MSQTMTAMDRMYRHQRHIYDLTRAYYLLGRDRMLRAMGVEPGQTVLEVGCGTGRNLAKLRKIAPGARLFGLDASEQMLETARAKLADGGSAVELRHVLAEDLDYRTTFGLDRPFDHLFFSYSLSMIPTWPEAIDAAVRNVRPGGYIHVVDFCDQAELPGWFAGLLKRWLDLFGVHFEPGVLERFHDLHARGVLEVEAVTLFRRYAYRVRAAVRG